MKISVKDKNDFDVLKEIKDELAKNGLEKIGVDGVWSFSRMIGVQLVIYGRKFNKIIKRVMVDREWNIDLDAVLEKAKELKEREKAIEAEREEEYKELERRRKLLDEITKKVKEVVNENLEYDVHVSYDDLDSRENGDRFCLKLDNLKEEELFKIIDLFKKLREVK